jgi:hypothetical protein
MSGKSWAYDVYGCIGDPRRPPIKMHHVVLPFEYETGNLAHAAYVRKLVADLERSDAKDLHIHSVEFVREVPHRE